MSIRKIDDYCYIFDGRKPSFTQVLKLAQSVDIKGSLDICWGENTISIEEVLGKFYGISWIKDISGEDIAQRLNFRKD